MVKVVLYDKETTYVLENGQLADPAYIKGAYPAVDMVNYIVLTDEKENWLYQFTALEPRMAFLDIPSDTPIADAIAQIEKYENCC